jgi:iron complex outermembrane receptor protein
VQGRKSAGVKQRSLPKNKKEANAPQSNEKIEGFNMSAIIGRTLLSVTLLGVCAVSARLAMAQEGTAEPPPEEIVVTALRRTEPLTQTPASVSVFTAQTLERANVERPADFIGLTPGVSLVHTAEIGDTQVSIRGINGARDAENSFAFVIDGIQESNPAGFNREFVDLQQIEVLKGPQGALYGRNAAAGAIIVTTKLPTDDYEGLAKFSYGTANTIVADGMVSGPIIPDKVLGRLSFNYRGTDGFYANRFLDAHVVDNLQSYEFNGRVIWKITDEWQADIKGRVGHAEGGAIDFNALFELPGFGAFNPNFYEDVNTHVFQFVNNIKPDNIQDSREVSVKIDHDYEWAHLSAWTLYSDIDNNFLTDGTAAAFGFYNRPDPATGKNYCQASINSLVASGFSFPSPQSPGLLGAYTPTTCDGYQYQLRNEQDVSAEIRLSSPSDQPLRWSGGIYYLHIDREVGVATGEDTGQSITKAFYDPLNTTSPTAQLFHDKYQTNVYAGFGSVSYDILPDLEAFVGVRYDIEDRQTENLVPTGDRQPFIALGAGSGGLYPLNPGLLTYPNGIPSRSRDFYQPEPKVSLRWTPLTETTLYLSWGVGFKSGGFNSAGSAATVAEIAAITGSDVKIHDDFNKETTNAFEGGIKGKLYDGVVTYELAGFYNKVDNLQFFEFFSGPEGLLRVVSNINQVDIHGLEAGVQLHPLKWLSFDGGVGVNYSTIMKNSARVDTIGNKSPYTPDYTATLGAEASTFVTDSIQAFGRVDVNFVGGTWFSTVQNQTVPSLFGPANFSKTERNPYNTVNLRAGIENANYTLAVYARNLLGTNYLAEVLPAPEFGGAFAHPGPKQEVGIEVSARF